MTKRWFGLAPTYEVVSCSPLADEPLSKHASVQVGRVLGAVADPVRLRLLSLLLSRAGAGACVCDLVSEVDRPARTLRHQLDRLFEGGFVDRERRGGCTFYVARPEALAGLRSLFTAHAANDQVAAR